MLIDESSHSFMLVLSSCQIMVGSFIVYTKTGDNYLEISYKDNLCVTLWLVYVHSNIIKNTTIC